MITSRSTLRALRPGFTRLIRTYPYVLTTVSVMLVFLAIAYATSRHIGIPVRDPEGTLLGRRMAGPLLLMVLFAALDSVRRAWRMRRAGSRERFIRLTVGIFVDRWWWKRLVLAIVGFLSFAFTYLAYRNLKSFVSLISYRSYDQELLALDRWLSFGRDPADVLHTVFGTDVAAHVLSYVYLIYIPLVPITVALAIAFTERMREAYVFVAAYMWCWILGTASYYMIPTLGPFASRSRLFVALDPTNVTRLQQSLEKHRFDLHADNIGEQWVGGIAGFASLHVGIVVCAWLLMRYLRNRPLEIVAFAFLIPTTIATIYFGWHFIIDDIAGAFIGWLSVLLGRVTVYPRLVGSLRRSARERHERRVTVARH